MEAAQVSWPDGFPTLRRASIAGSLMPTRPLLTPSPTRVSVFIATLAAAAKVFGGWLAGRWATCYIDAVPEGRRYHSLGDPDLDLGPYPILQGSEVTEGPAAREADRPKSIKLGFADFSSPLRDTAAADQYGLDLVGIPSRNSPPCCRRPQ